MSDAQFGALIAAILAAGGGISATVRWAVGRLTTALDNNTHAWVNAVASMAVLSTKIDGVTSWVHENTPVEIQKMREPSERTRRSGYRPPRPGTNHDDT